MDQPAWRINPALERLARPIETLREDPKNVRRHPERNRRAIANSLSVFGQQKPVVALKDGTVIAGSGTLHEALGLAADRLAVVTFAVPGPGESWINPDLRYLARPLSDFHPDPHNARTHGGRNLDVIVASLRLFGQQKPIVVDANGLIRAGNGTWEAAGRLGRSDIAAVEFDGTVSQAAAYALADNRTAELAEWDNEELAAVLKKLNDEGVNSADLGWDEAELEALLAQDWSPPASLEDLEDFQRTITVKFSPEQWAIIKRAVGICRANGDGSLTDNEAVTCACEDYTLEMSK